MKMRTVSLFLVLSLFAPFAGAQEEEAQQQQVQEESVGPQEVVTLDGISKVLFYLAAMALAGGYLIYSLKRGKWVPGKTKGQKLRVVETHSLGNKQFLLVVEYGLKRMMLGVVPGSITKLTDLDPEPLDELTPDAPDNTKFTVNR